MADAKIAVIIVGAGQGERFGGNQNKVLAKLDGRPIFLRSIEHFSNREDVCQTVFVASPNDMETIKTKYAANLALMGVGLAEGGATRAESVRAGLAKISEDTQYIAVHDAARPCVSFAMIDAVFSEATKTGAAILAAPLSGTIKRVSGAGVIEATVSREGLYEAQTPQVFARNVLESALESAPEGEEFTDDAQFVEHSGHPVSIVKSDSSNLKVTTKGDLTLAAAILKSRPQKQIRSLGAFEEAQW